MILTVGNFYLIKLQLLLQKLQKNIKLDKL